MYEVRLKLVKFNLYVCDNSKIEIIIEPALICKTEKMLRAIPLSKVTWGGDMKMIRNAGVGGIK